ncbi:MAG: NAD(P)H-dependent oxidoreductase [Gammaproteobacteria bacterium]|nr:NAD(P)H-dependent oxidoreductase [Gammaproteobacteria bacterium]
MPRLLIVYHSKSGQTQRMADAVHAGATDDEIESTDVVMKQALEADASDLLAADGLILGTPENFGYMSGGMKDFLDRTFYEVEGKIKPLPCGIFISAGNDGTGALTAIRRIGKGYPFIEVQEPIIVKGVATPDQIEACRELGLAMAIGLEAGIY